MLTQIDPVTLAHTLDQASKREPEKQQMILAPRVATVLELPQLLQTPAPPSNMMVQRAVFMLRAGRARRSSRGRSALRSVASSSFRSLTVPC